MVYIVIIGMALMLVGVVALFLWPSKSGANPMWEFRVGYRVPHTQLGYTLKKYSIVEVMVRKGKIIGIGRQYGILDGFASLEELEFEYMRMDMAFRHPLIDLDKPLDL